MFLVHPGGPFWARKDAGVWSIPKGEFAEGDRRELTEETGCVATGPFTPLGSVRQPGGKTVHAFLARADVDPDKIVSNRFRMEWPPRSGRWQEFPEVDRAAWFSLESAAEKIHPAQAEFLRGLCRAGM